MKLKQKLNKIIATVFGENVSSIFTHGGVYLGGEVLTKIAFLISLPIITRLLSVEEYGYYQVYQSYATLALVFLTLNFHSSVARYYFDEKDDLDSFLFSSALGSLLFLIVSSSIVYMFSDALSEFANVSTGLIRFILLSCLFGIPYSIYTQLCIAQKKSNKFVLVNLFKIYFALLIGVPTVFLFMEDKYYGLVIGNIVCGFVLAIVTSIYLFRRMRARINFLHVKYIFEYSVPLVPYVLSNVILGQIDRVMINKYIGPYEAGIYSLSYNFAMILGMVTASLQQALVPDWFKMMRNREYCEIDNVVAKVFLIGAVIALVLIAFSREVITVFADSEFVGGYVIVPIVVFGYIFESVFKIYGRHIGFTNKMIYVSFVGILSGGFNVWLNSLLLPIYGYVSAAYTTLASYFLMAFLAWFISKHILKQRVTEIKHISWPFFVVFASVVITVAINKYYADNYTFGFLSRTLVFVFCTVLLFLQKLKMKFFFGV